MLSPTAFGEQCKQRIVFFQLLGKQVDVLKYALLLRQNYKGLGNLVRNLNFPKPFQNLNQNLPSWPDIAQNILHNLDGQHVLAWTPPKPTRNLPAPEPEPPWSGPEPPWNIPQPSSGTCPETFPEPVEPLLAKTP